MITTRRVRGTMASPRGPADSLDCRASWVPRGATGVATWLVRRESTHDARRRRTGDFGTAAIAAPAASASPTSPHGHDARYVCFVLTPREDSRFWTFKPDRADCQVGSRRRRAWLAWAARASIAARVTGRAG